MAEITNDRTGRSFTVQDGDTILRAALRAGVGMPYSCNTGSCGNCRFEVVEGSVRHLRTDPPAWSERDLKRNRWLGCQAVPQGDCRVKFREMDDYIPPVKPTLQSAVLQSVRTITRDISEFTFEIDGDFRPGQYALIHVPGVEGGRAYSMSSIAGDGAWRFMIKRMPGGAVSGWLFEAEPGAEVEIDGPYGTAYLQEDVERDLLLLAGGSGLSPMVSIARGALSTRMDATRTIHFWYGGREKADLCGPDVIGVDLADRIEFSAVLSEPESDWDGPKGFLHEASAKALGDALQNCEIYFAGPAVMAGAIQKIAHEAGVPMDRLHFDEFY